MKKFSMLTGATCLIIVNIYGIFISTYFKPIASAVLVMSILTTILLIYIEINKRRILIDGRRRESFVLFALTIIFQIYFTITAFTILVYLNTVELGDQDMNLRLGPLTVGLHTLPIHQTQALNLSYYFASFLLFIYYLRCFYVMFWKQNIVFIFRYLKSHVQSLNQTLLSHLPKIVVTHQMKQTICALCLQNYSDEQDVTKLHCQHIFHLDCIKIWVMKSNCCPLCRRKVVF